MAYINWSNVTSLSQIPTEANNVSGGSFWVGMFHMMWVIFIFLFIGFGFEVAMVVASFLMIVIGLLMVYADLIAWQHLLTVIGTLLFMFLYIIWSSTKVRN